MSEDKFRGPPPGKTPEQIADGFARMWSLTAERAADVAASKRTMYLAYLAEGFTEQQALTLVQSL